MKVETVRTQSVSQILAGLRERLRGVCPHPDEAFDFEAMRCGVCGMTLEEIAHDPKIAARVAQLESYFWGPPSDALPSWILPDPQPDAIVEIRP